MPASMTLLKLSPENTLHFCKAGQQASPSRILKVTNVSGGNVAFKVKTTAPKSYLVRPSSGTLKPDGEQEVQIILQAQGAEGNPATHRFLVQAVATNSSEPLQKDQWADLAEGAKKNGGDGIQEQRLNVELAEREEPSNAGGQPAPARSWEAPVTSTSNDAAASELKVKYDELVQYTLMLEKEKKKLTQTLQSQTGKGQGSQGKPSDVGQWTAMHLLAVAVLVFSISFGAKFVV